MKEEDWAAKKEGHSNGMFAQGRVNQVGTKFCTCFDSDGNRDSRLSRLCGCHFRRPTLPLPKGGYIQFPADGERERETLSRNNGRHSVSGKAKKEGRGLVERGDDVIL